MIRKASTILTAFAICALFATAGFAKQTTIRGKLQKTVEANGWLIVAGKLKYLILNPQKFQNEKWFAEANEVVATGEVKKGVVTIYMEGTPFNVHSMRPASRTKSKPSIDAVWFSDIIQTADSVPRVREVRSLALHLC